MKSWEEYIKSNILEFRKRYNELPEEFRRSLDDPLITRQSLNKPSQVVVIDFRQIFPKYFILLHSKKYPDMEIIVYENLTPKAFFNKISEEKPMWLELVNAEDIEYHIRPPWSEKEEKSWVLTFLTNYILMTFGYDPRSSEYEFSNLFYEDIYSMFETAKQRTSINETVKELKKDAEAIPLAELRTKMLESTERLEGQIRQLNDRLGKEINMLRQMIGRSEKYLDWKAFTTDFEHLKTTHLTRETFEAHVKRLDEKIDKGLEALNTRIEDLKAIKFWSKRTLLEIALGIIALIATLYGAGVIKL